MYDDDWELFVPERGELYPPKYEYSDRYSKGWVNGLYAGEKITTRNISTVAQYRRPKQKETKMPDRTPQQALRDAIDSGAVEAWINGEEIQCDGGGVWKDYEVHEGLTPNFQHSGINWKPKPPEPTKINWQPVVTGKEPEGHVMLLWKQYGCCVSATYDPARNRWIDWDKAAHFDPTHWAPMCNLPEGDK